MDLKSCNVQGHWDVDPFIAARIMLKLTTSQATKVSAKAQSLDRLEASPHTPKTDGSQGGIWKFVVNRNWLMDNNNTICKSYIYIYVNVYIYKYIIIPTTNLVNKTDHKTVGKSDANGYQLSSTFWTSQPISSMNMLQHHEVYPSTPPSSGSQHHWNIF